VESFDGVNDVMCKLDGIKTGCDEEVDDLASDDDDDSTIPTSDLSLTLELQLFIDED